MSDSLYKLQQLILYVASQTESAEHFGTTKINKVLFRSEFAAYRELGSKLTDFHYQKNDFGPTLRAFQPITAEMERASLIEKETRRVGSRTETRLRALVPPDMSVFDERQKAIVDAEIQRAWDHTARRVSDEEHRTAAWYATPMNETIMPELCFVEDPEDVLALSDAEQARAGAAIERYLARTSETAHTRLRARVR